MIVIIGGVDGLSSSLKDKKEFCDSRGGVPGHRIIVGASSNGDASWILNVGITGLRFLVESIDLVGE